RWCITGITVRRPEPITRTRRGTITTGMTAIISAVMTGIAAIGAEHKSKSIFHPEIRFWPDPCGGLFFAPDLCGGVYFQHPVVHNLATNLPAVSGKIQSFHSLIRLQSTHVQYSNVQPARQCSTLPVPSR